jgi:two-component system sensor histidine kinase/response regulator
LKKTKFDLILLDVMMPEMNGFEVCSKIRSNKKLKGLPVIFLTAQTERESILKGFELGAQDYVTKPFEERELMARVRTHLELKLSREKLESVNQLLEEKVEQRTSELKTTLQQLEQAHHQLIKADKSKAEFLEMISKEIRSPLNHILGIVDSLKAKVDSQDLFDLINLLDQTVSTLEKFSSSAIQLTALRSSKESIKLEDTSLKQFIEFCLLENAELLHQKRIKISHEEFSSEITLKSNGDLLMKLLSTIIDSILLIIDQNSNLEFSSELSESEVTVNMRGRSDKSLESGVQKLKSELLLSDEIVDPKTRITAELFDLILDIHHASLVIDQSEHNEILIRLKFRTN